MKTAKVLGMLLPVLGLAVSAPVAAVSWNTSTPSIAVTSGSIYCSTTTCQTSSSGLTGSVMTMSAYSTATVGSPPGEAGNWLSARIAIYSGGGVGISNNVAGDTSEGNTPEHAIDNNGVNDMLVVDFGSNNWDVSSFSLGYTCTMDTSGACTGSTVNVDAWVGGSSAINFNNVAFSGNGSSATLPGFTALTLTPNDGIGGTGTRSDSGSAVGRYLVIAGNLGDYTSAFKVSGVVATQTTPGVPLPSTVPLLALGLLALTWVSRRRPQGIRAVS